jgi:hypothetical protein
LTAKRTGRPPKPKNRKLSTQLNVRIKDDLVKLIDAKACELADVYPEIEWNRGQVVRHMLYKLFKDEQDDE